MFGPLGPSAKTNWLGKNEWVTRIKKHGGRRALFCPRANMGKIMFFVWVDLSEHKWVILAERRGSTNSPNFFASLPGLVVAMIFATASRATPLVISLTKPRMR